MHILRLERRQEEWITSVLDSKDAHKETIHPQNDGAPYDDHDLLCFRIGDAWDLERQCYGGKGQHAVCKAVVSA